MKARFALFILLLLAAVGVRAQEANLLGRWEFVNLTGDSLAQYNPDVTPITGYPIAFSGYLTEFGGGVKSSTLDSAQCDQVLGSNVDTAWKVLESGQIQVIFTVSGNSTGVFQFIYTGTLTSRYLRTADDGSQVAITAIYGTYTTTGDVSACSTGAGEFVATHFPDLGVATYQGHLTSDPNSPHVDQATVAATIRVSPVDPHSNGLITGTIELGTISLGGNACFDPINETTTLTILPRSYQTGMFEVVFAQDKNGNQFYWSAQSANLSTNLGDPAGTPVDGFKATGAAVGEDDIHGGISGIANDGTNNILVAFYAITGGPCDGIEGVDSQYRPITEDSAGGKHNHRRVCKKGDHKHSWGSYQKHRD